MLKNSTYRDKFSLLNFWMPYIAEAIKKELKQDHLKSDWGFAKKYFAGKNIAKLTADELADGYLKAILEDDNGDNIGEFIANRWLLKHGEIYHFFDQELTQINANVEEIEVLEAEKSREIADASIQKFGAPATYLFSVINSVVFPEACIAEMEQRAKSDLNVQQELEAAIEGERSIDKIKKECEMQIARLTDKYEKKLLGLQKKYLKDVEGLKKQIASLHKQLNGK